MREECTQDPSSESPSGGLDTLFVRMSSHDEEDPAEPEQDFLNNMRDTQRSCLEHIAAMEMELMAHEAYNAAVQFTPFSEPHREHHGTGDALAVQAMEAELRAAHKRTAVMEARSVIAQQRIAFVEAERDEAVKQVKDLAASQLQAQSRIVQLESDLTWSNKRLAEAEAREACLLCGSVQARIEKADLVTRHHLANLRDSGEESADMACNIAELRRELTESSPHSSKMEYVHQTASKNTNCNVIQDLSCWNGELLLLL